MPITKRNPRDPDSPFLTKEAIGKGLSFRERFPHLDPKKITVVCVPDEPIKSAPRRAAKRPTTNLPLANDIVLKLRATGPEWPDLANRILRDGLKKLKQRAA